MNDVILSHLSAGWISPIVASSQCRNMVAATAGLQLKPSMTWLIVFLPALGYYMVTRLYEAGLFRGSTIGQIVGTKLIVLPSTADGSGLRASCQALESIFYTTTTTTTATATSKSPSSLSCTTVTDGADHQDVIVELKHPLYMVQEELDHVVATCWKHDTELGRGFLLLSTAGGNGRVWRWETGGGPIAIGRTLSVENSGCRSEHYRSCNNVDRDNGATTSVYGSGGIAIDSMSSSGTGDSTSVVESEHFAEGKIVIAEWGEGRIARMEENGARTPLVIQIPDHCSDGADVTTIKTRRVHQSRVLLFTPFGDLLFLDKNEGDDAARDGCGDSVFRLPQAIDIEPLKSLQISREAHSWTELRRGGGTPTHDHKPPKQHQEGEAPYKDERYLGMLPESLFRATKIGGMALDTTWVNVIVTAKLGDGRIVLLSVPLGTEDNEVEEECEAGHGAGDSTCKRVEATSTVEPTVIVDYTIHADQPGPIAIDKNGNFYLGTDGGVMIVVDTTRSAKKSSKRKNEGNTKHFEIVGIVRTPKTPVSLTLGEDGFLYIATETSLLRIRAQHGPVQIPTNLVLSKKR